MKSFVGVDARRGQRAGSPDARNAAADFLMRGF
jgi:hypothetical protein